MIRFANRRVALVAAFFILIACVTLIGQRLAVQRNSALSCLIEDTRTGGGSGIRAWAERLGWHTRPLRSPLWEAGNELPGTGHCAITAGNGSWNLMREFTHEDWILLSNWIQKGNTLIVVTSSPASLPKEVRSHFSMPELRTNSDSKGSFLFSKQTRKLLSGKSTHYDLVPTWWGGKLSVDSEGPRLKDLPTQQQLAGQGKASVLSVAMLGQGRIYLLLDESAWTNSGFDRADNAATLARIIKPQLGPDGFLAIDEYRHGFGRAESFTTLFLSLPGARDFTLMALAWGLFWLWGSTRRFSPPDEFRETERRTAIEYIDSVAAIYQRARAAPLTIKAVLNRMRYLLKKRGIVNEIANTTMERAELYAALGERPAAPKSEIAIVTELIKLRKELYGTRWNSREG